MVFGSFHKFDFEYKKAVFFNDKVLLFVKKCAIIRLYQVMGRRMLGIPVIVYE